MKTEVNAKQDLRPGLIRGLGAASAAGIVLGTMIGTGIFLKPSEMAQETGAVGLVFAAWVVAGLLSLFGALCYAELGTSIPEAGGEYAYLRRGLGEVWGFLFGWMHSIVARPASGAAIAAGLLRFCAFLFPVLAEPIHVFHLHLPFLPNHPSDFVFTWMQPSAVVAVILITFINYLGVRVGGGVQVVLTVMKVVAVVLIIVGGFTLIPPHSRGQFSTPWWPSSMSWGAVSGFLAALAAAAWAYDGWNNLNLVGSEVKDPERNFPRVIVGGVIFVIFLFLLFNVVCFRALPFDVLRSSEHVASDVFSSFAGRSAAIWITVAMAISALGTLNSSMLSGARVDYAMARDGIFFHFAAQIHPKHRTPGNALVFQCCVAGLMALTGTFEDLTSLVMFGSWIFYGLAVVSMLRMRHTEPKLPRPFRTWGYPVLPIVFILGAAALALSLWIARPVRSSAGLALILFGLVFYRSWRSAPPRETSSS